MPAFTITCTECQASLKSAKPVPAGKVVTCPKCGMPFKVPAPKPVSAGRFEAVDDVEVIDEEDVEVVDEMQEKKEKTAEKKRLTSGKAPKARAGKAKRAKMSTVKLLSIIGGIVFGIAALGIGGVLVWKHVINAPSDAVSYIPNESLGAAGFDFAKIYSDTPHGPSLERLFVYGPGNRYFGLANVSPKQMLDKVMVAFDAGGKGAATVFTRSPLEKAKVIDAFGAKAKSVGGRDAYQTAALANSCFLMNSPRTLTILAPGFEETAAPQIGKGNPSPALSAMVTKISGAHVWLAIDPQAPGQWEKAIAQNPMLAMMPRKNLDEVRAIGVTAKYSSTDITLTIYGLGKPGYSAAADVKKYQEQADAMKTTMSAAPLTMVPPEAQPIFLEAISSTKVSAQGEFILLTCKIKAATADRWIRDQIDTVVTQLRGGR